MFSYKLFSIIAHTLLVSKNPDNETETNEAKRFPDDFSFGVSTAAYQIEGGWNADGKGPSIWDEFTHSNPDKIEDGQNGDITSNSYEYFLDDIKAIKQMNMNHYRFSIAWSRVLPDGDVSNVNEKGIEYYDKMINALRKFNIEPMITMYHFDLPLKLQDLGGWTNEIIVEYFKAYANLLFERFGDRVKYWITLNEPALFCRKSFGHAEHPPLILSNGVGEYLCGHNALKAHAITYRLYKSSFFDRFSGRVGISLDSRFYYSQINDTATVDRSLQFLLGWFAHPIFSSEGNYPTIMINQIANNSVREGRAWSRLPTFSKQWIDTIRGSADFLGLNYYTSRYVKMSDKPLGRDPSFDRDRNVKEWINRKWKPSSLDWLFSVPRGLGDILRWVKNEYDSPEVFITENGWVDEGEIEDNGRIAYIRDHLNQVLDVLQDKECNLKGYTIWTLIDNFEWARGFIPKFGLYSVNMTSPRKERRPKKSAHFMELVTTTRQIPSIY